MTMTRRHFTAMSGLGLASVMAMPSVLRAQSDLKTARMIVGFGAGGSLDIVARLLAEHIKDYAATVIVENRVGAGGRLALEALRTAPADGSTIVLTPGEQLSLFPHIYKNLSYDALRDFAPVSTVCTVQFLLVAGPLVPASVNTFDAFVAWCRANPAMATYGTPGAGTRHHFFGQTLARVAGFDFRHVPYKSAPLILQDVLAGQIAAGIVVTSNALANIRSGQLRALVTTAPLRNASLPDVPTVKEAGYPTLESVEWFGLLAPRATPRTSVDALSTATRQALGITKVRETLASLSMEIAGSTPDELAWRITSDFATWAKVVKESDFKPLD